MLCRHYIIVNIQTSAYGTWLYAEISGAESQDNKFSGAQNHFQVQKNICRQG